MTVLSTTESSSAEGLHEKVPLLPRNDVIEKPIDNEERTETPAYLSRNISLTLWYFFFREAASSVWYGSVLSAYVYLIDPQHPALVGYLSATEGVTQFFVAMLTGIVADLYRRDRLLQLASVVGITGSVLTFLSAWYHEYPSLALWFMAIALPTWGIFDGIGRTANMALFADSISDGQRSYYFTQRTTVSSLGDFLGPVVAILLFLFLGDQWKVGECATVIEVGQLVLIPSFTLLCFFRDVETTSGGAESKGARDAIAKSETASTVGDSSVDGYVDFDDEASTSTREGEMFLFGLMTKGRFIAASSATSDLLCALASGASYRYFAIFFLQDLQYGPVFVQVLRALAHLTTITLLQVAQKLALRVGRAFLSVVFKGIGVVFLVLMILVYLFFDEHLSSRPPTWLFSLLYLLQGGFLNSTQALTKSLVMDHVPSHERAKWSSVESLNVFGWCGSAALGGFIVSKFHGNIWPVFALSAILQFSGILPLVGLFGIENLEEQDSQEE